MACALQELATFQARGYVEFVHHFRELTQQGHFRGRVHGPILAEITVRKQAEFCERLLAWAVAWHAAAMLAGVACAGRLPTA